MNNVGGLDELFDAIITQIYESLRTCIKEKIYIELDNDRKLDARTVGICLGIIDNVIDDMLEDEEEYDGRFNQQTGGDCREP